MINYGGALRIISNELLNQSDDKPYYTDEEVFAITYIFATAVMDRMYDLQQREKISLSDSGLMAEAAGNDIRKLIKTYTGLDTHNI